jgi:hypothetical protein
MFPQIKINLHNKTIFIIKLWHILPEKGFCGFVCMSRGAERFFALLFDCKNTTDCAKPAGRKPTQLNPLN